MALQERMGREREREIERKEYIYGIDKYAEITTLCIYIDLYDL